MFLGIYDQLLSETVVSFVSHQSLIFQMIIIGIARYADRVFIVIVIIAMLQAIIRQAGYYGHLMQTLYRVLIASLGSIVGWFAILIAKHLYAVPRPFTVGIVDTLWNAAGHAFPSGHAAVLVMVAYAMRPLVTRPVWVGLCVAAIVIPLTRFAVGAHSIVDIMAGWVIGYVAGVLIDIGEQSL